MARDSSEDRRHRARTLASLFAAGALVSSTAVVVPGWPQMDRAGIGVTIVLAAGGALTLTLFADRIGRRICHAFTLVGTVLIAACQVLAGGGSATATYGMLYIWVILHCALFFSGWAVAAHLAATTVAHVLALVWLGDLSSVAPQLALTVGTQIAAASVVGSLARKMRRLADTDALTGLDNRRVLHRALKWQMARSRRSRHAATWVAVLDLDGFKAFNDLHGHLAGDQLLVEAATTWRSHLRETDTLARTGGDEFTLVLADCSREEAVEIVGRMTQRVPTGVSCSAGLALWDGHEPVTGLVARADAALYEAKSKDLVVVTAAHGSSVAPEVLPAT